MFFILVLHIGLAYFVSSIISASTCGGDISLGTCGSTFPADFCCPFTTTCSLYGQNDLMTTICCPTGKDCLIIAPITCNITLQDVSIFPSVPFHTLNLTERLSPCGNNCCPLGFTCQNEQCHGTSLYTAPVQTIPSTVFSTPPPTRTVGSATTTATKSANSSMEPIPEQTDNIATAAIIASVVIGLLILFIVVFAICRYRRQYPQRTISEDVQNVKKFFGKSPPKSQISLPITQARPLMRNNFSNNKNTTPIYIDDPSISLKHVGIHVDRKITVTSTRGNSQVAKVLTTPPPIIQPPIIPSRTTSNTGSPVAPPRSRFSKSELSLRRQLSDLRRQEAVHQQEGLGSVARNLTNRSFLDAFRGSRNASPSAENKSIEISWPLPPHVEQLPRKLTQG